MHVNTISQHYHTSQVASRRTCSVKTTAMVPHSAVILLKLRGHSVAAGVCSSHSPTPIARIECIPTQRHQQRLLHTLNHPKHVLQATVPKGFLKANASSRAALDIAWQRASHSIRHTVPTAALISILHTDLLVIHALRMLHKVWANSAHCLRT